MLFLIFANYVGGLYVLFFNLLVLTHITFLNFCQKDSCSTQSFISTTIEFVMWEREKKYTFIHFPANTYLRYLKNCCHHWYCSKHALNSHLYMGTKFLYGMGQQVEQLNQ